MAPKLRGWTVMIFETLTPEQETYFVPPAFAGKWKSIVCVAKELNEIDSECVTIGEYNPVNTAQANAICKALHEANL